MARTRRTPYTNSISKWIQYSFPAKYIITNVKNYQRTCTDIIEQAEKSSLYI